MRTYKFIFKKRECGITMEEFSAGEKATDSKFLKDNGFMNLTSCFYLKRKLYENKITLTVTIEKETKWRVAYK